MAVAQGHVHQHSFKMMENTMERPQSALLRGVQITEFKDSRVNPQPIVLEETDILMEGYLSPTKLRLLAGVDNLDCVHSLEMKVNTCDTTLGNFGGMLPNLTQLKLSNSVITCIRDVGSSLRSLRVLWMSRCGLQELDGLSSMGQLTELYLSYNELSDLSPVSMLDSLQILDLEGNNIADINQIQYLELCSELQSLTLEANPVCVMPTPDSQEINYDYRKTIKNMLPQLQYLDDEPVINAESSQKANVFDEDWAFLDDLQKDLSLQNLNSLDSAEDEGIGGVAVGGVPALANFRPGSALRPSSGMRPLTCVPQTSPSVIRPKTRGSPASSAGRPTTAARPPSTEENEVGEAASALTTGGVICGNPCRALRSRRGDSFTPPAKETGPKLFAQYRHKAEHTYDPAPLEGQSNEELLEELKAWREHHDEVIKKIQKEKAPQVLRIVPDETHDWSDSDELTSSGEEIQSDEESGVQRLSNCTDNESQPRETAHVKPPTQPASNSGSGRPRTPEFRSRRYHTHARRADQSGEAQTFPAPQKRHDESFEEGEKPSTDVRTAVHHSPPRVCSVGMNHQSPIPPVLPNKPVVSSIPRHSPKDRHPTHEPLRTGYVAPEAGVLTAGVRTAGASVLPVKPPSSRAALALPSQLRIKRQLPTVPSQKSRPGEGL